MGFALFVAKVTAQLGLQTTFQTGTDDLLNKPVCAVELDLATIDKAHQLIERARVLVGIHGAKGSDFLGNIGSVFHALFGLVFLDSHIVFS